MTLLDAYDAASHDRKLATRRYMEAEAPLASLAGLDAVVAARYHACVAAMLAGIPFLALTYEQKIDQLMREMGREGDQRYDLREEPNLDRLAPLVDSLFTTPDLWLVSPAALAASRERVRRVNISALCGA
jgi:hypothetical protein